MFAEQKRNVHNNLCAKFTCLSKSYLICRNIVNIFARKLFSLDSQSFKWEMGERENEKSTKILSKNFENIQINPEGTR